MNNVINFNVVKDKRDNSVGISPLERAKNILAPKNKETKTTLTKKIKQILRSRDVKFRITHDDIDSKIYTQSRTILFPDYKFAFFIGNAEINTKLDNGWSIKQLKLDNKKEIIVYAGRIINCLDELSKNGAEKEKK